MKATPELISDFKDWFFAFQGVEYVAWLNSQDKKTIEDTIMDFLENRVEVTYSQGKSLARQIYRELKNKGGQ